MWRQNFQLTLKRLTAPIRQPPKSNCRRNQVLNLLTIARCKSTLLRDGNITISPLPSIEIPEINIAEYVLRDLPKYKNKTALVNGLTGESWSYAQLNDAIIKVGSSLVKMGIKKGDVVTVLSPNCPEFVVIYLATQAVGGVISAVNPMYKYMGLAGKTNKVHQQLCDSQSKLLVCDAALCQVARKASIECTSLKAIVSFGTSDGCHPFSSLMDDGIEHFPTSMDVNAKEDLCALPYSSGTTGLPKGVMLTHYNLVSNLTQLSDTNFVNYDIGNESFLAVLPFFHIYGQVVVMLVGLKTGSTITTMPKFDPQIFLKLCQEKKVTFLHVVPPIANFLAKHPVIDKFDLTSVRTLLCGAAPVAPHIATVVAERLNLKSFRQGFGMTESSPVTHANLEESWKPHSCGPPIANCEHRVLDLKTGMALANNQEGEIVVRGPNIMKGYYNNKQATRDTIKNGWLHTGDIGFSDDDGHIVISDRLKELIKVKGFQVAPAELEALLLTHPKIQEAAVIGKPDERSGELPRAYVVLKPQTFMTREEIKAYVADKVPEYKQLQGGVVICSEIPKSESGKILRRVLKAELRQSQ